MIFLGVNSSTLPACRHVTSKPCDSGNVRDNLKINSSSSDDDGRESCEVRKSERACSGPGWSPGRGGGGCHLPAPSCCSPAPPARSGRWVPGPRVSAAGLRLRAGVESVECGHTLSPAPCQSCPRGAGEHITSLSASQVTSQTSAVSLQPSHIITSSPEPHKCAQFVMNK